MLCRRKNLAKKLYIAIGGSFGFGSLINANLARSNVVDNWRRRLKSDVGVAAI